MQVWRMWVLWNRAYCPSERLGLKSSGLDAWTCQGGRVGVSGLMPFATIAF